MATVRPGIQNLSGKRDEGSSDINESGEPEEWMEGAGIFVKDYVSSYAWIATNSYAIWHFLTLTVTDPMDISGLARFTKRDDSVTAHSAAWRMFGFETCWFLSLRTPLGCIDVCS